MSATKKKNIQGMDSSSFALALPLLAIPRLNIPRLGLRGGVIVPASPLFIPIPTPGKFRSRGCFLKVSGSTLVVVFWLSLGGEVNMLRQVRGGKSGLGGRGGWGLKSSVVDLRAGYSVAKAQRLTWEWGSGKKNLEALHVVWPSVASFRFPHFLS